MDHDPRLSIPIGAPSSERRQHGRQRSAAISCDRGVIVDVSLGGVRIRSRGRLAGEVSLTFRSDGDVVELLARAVWSQPLGFGRYLGGLEFVDELSGDALELLSLDRGNEHES